MSNIGIILAGGKGERYGRRKQFVELSGKALYMHVYEKLLTILPKENIVIVGVDIEGGKTRSHSVINGLNYFKEKNESYNKVIIVEAARPLVTVEQMKTLINSTDKSATFVMPLVNTVIKRDGTYQNRDDFYDLLTPQCFNYNLLYDAYSKKDNWNMTDETRVIYEAYGIKPKFILGGQNLVKLTYKKDLPVLENMLNMMEENIL